MGISTSLAKWILSFSAHIHHHLCLSHQAPPLLQSQTSSLCSRTPPGQWGKPKNNKQDTCYQIFHKDNYNIDGIHQDNPGKRLLSILLRLAVSSVRKWFSTNLHTDFTLFPEENTLQPLLNLNVLLFRWYKTTKCTVWVFLPKCSLRTFSFTLLKIKTMVFYLHPWTYPNKGPVTKVVDGAKEPELVEEKIGSCHGALVWMRQRKHKNMF